MPIIDNAKYYIINVAVANKYTIALVPQPNNPINYRFIVSQSGAVVFSCDYNDIEIDSSNPTSLLIQSDNFYGEFSALNTVDFTYSNLIGGLTNLTVANVEITRPANTTAYIAKDVIGTIMTFTNALKTSAGNGYVTKVRLMGDVPTQTFKAKLHLYAVSPSAVVDNDPFTLLYANTTNRLGAIELQALSTEGTGSTACSTIWTAGKADTNGFAQGILAVKGATGSNTIYGILETLDAFTPTSGGKYFIELTIDNI